MSSPERKKALLMLADGSIFEGFSIGHQGTSGGEICFNTGMTGYQEIYTDPSYFGQIVINTNAHIGNYGVHLDENESDKPKIKGLVVNDFTYNYSRNTASGGLDDYLKSHGTVGISDIDTRMLVRQIRSKGAMNAIISSDIDDLIRLQEELNKIPNMHSLELSSQVTTEHPYELGTSNTGLKVAILDLGVKRSIINNFIVRNYQVKVFPAKTTFAQMSEWKADGYFISNGPGDPAVMDYAVRTVQDILNVNKPIFGICLGNQLLARAVNIDTFKMHHGHRGLNHPVKNLVTGKSEITSQNHGFAVNMESLKNSKLAELTHVNLNDQSVEGLRLLNGLAFSVQYHPESTPGPHDSTYLFDDFTQLINNKR
ncbi:MAG: glutamine-hydrolyzing carbamoyl-phosphate synthase small subunit [Flammeovirgaceae bacterium]|jgi:carbamoyl-phosphate synthase small subunit|nr:glutamine-hydrolyzing carbamoyl-phosphate synthase small subunit [Flammeovirgaceae bacterium]|tara:strand:- start:40710 stop:41816 length:1107 start_codon:yes stop_codon:yes gene_type:complete